MMNEWCIDDSFWQEVESLIFPPECIDLAHAEVSAMLAAAGKGPLAILDLGCGVGRHCFAFAQLGHQVTGVDRSAYLLAKARERQRLLAPLKIDFQCLDLRAISWENRFDFAVCLYSSFGYFARREDDLLVLSNALRSLKSGGRLIIELGSKETIARHYAPLQFFGMGEERSFLHRIILPGWQQLLLSWYLNQQGTFKIYHTKVRIYAASELTALVREAGFAQVEVFSDFSGSSFDGDAKRLVVIAEKA